MIACFLSPLNMFACNKYSDLITLIDTNDYQNFKKMVYDMYSTFEKRSGITADKITFDEELTLMKLPLHLVGIFNETPRSVPRGTFLGNSNQMIRSRTLSMFSSNVNSNFRGSVPDLSRSVPTTPMLTFKNDRVLKHSSSSMPRYPDSNSKWALENTIDRASLQLPTELPLEADELVKIRTSSFLSDAEKMSGANPSKLLTTFLPARSSNYPKIYEDRDNVVYDHFSDKTEHLNQIRHQPNSSLLHSSSSFMIKRPSFVPNRNTTTVQNLHKMPSFANYAQQQPDSTSKKPSLAGQKAAELLAEVQPTLRASTKCDQNFILSEESYDGLILNKTPKYAIPRVVANTIEKREQTYLDSSTA